ncbi:MAG: hypothetical protein LC118_21720 [Dehalococcoidia bacterium]|nr:hypothetical protein [Dehalococcoidia bacterium]
MQARPSATFPVLNELPARPADSGLCLVALLAEFARHQRFEWVEVVMKKKPFAVKAWLEARFENALRAPPLSFAILPVSHQLRGYRPLP